MEGAKRKILNMEHDPHYLFGDECFSVVVRAQTSIVVSYKCCHICGKYHAH